MDTLRSVAHLQRELGDDLFNVLVSSDNTEAVRQFAQKLVGTAMTIGDRTYEILGFLQGDEKFVKGDIMVARVKEMNANLGKDDGQYLLDHQDEIPVALRGKVVFVFTDWRHPAYPMHVYCVYWFVHRWVRISSWLDHDFYVNVRVLRRKYGA